MHFVHRLLWEYGTCRGYSARRNRWTGSVQMRLWKKGQRGRTRDHWHGFDRSWWSEFVPTGTGSGERAA